MGDVETEETMSVEVEEPLAETVRLVGIREVFRRWQDYLRL